MWCLKKEKTESSRYRGSHERDRERRLRADVQLTVKSPVGNWRDRHSAADQVGRGALSRQHSQNEKATVSSAGNRYLRLVHVP